MGTVKRGDTDHHSQGERSSYRLILKSTKTLLKEPEPFTGKSAGMRAGVLGGLCPYSAATPILETQVF